LQFKNIKLQFNNINYIGAAITTHFMIFTKKRRILFPILQLVFFLFLTIQGTFSFAQQPNFKFGTLNVLSGISNSKTTSVIEDSIGYLWFGTEEGLFRFDGQNVFPYVQDVNNPNSLPSSGITNLILDREDNLWICTFSGICKYNREFDNFTQIKDKSDLKGFTNKTIQVIAFDKSDQLFVVYEKTIYKYNQSENQFSKVLELDHGKINDLIFDDQNNMWIAASMNGGLFCFDQLKKQLTPYLNDPTNKQSISINEINDIAISGETLWIATIGGGIDAYNLKDKTFKHYTSSKNLENFANSIFISRKKEVWICTYASLKLFNAAGDYFYNFFNTPNNPNSVGKALNGFYEDRSGNYWTIQSIDEIRIARNNLKFSYIETNLGAFWRTSEKIITALTYDGSGRLWIGNFHNGIDIFCWQEQRTIRLKHDVNDPKSIGEGTIHSIFCDSKKQVWVGSSLGGLQRYNPEHNNFDSYKPNPEDTFSIAGNDVRSISEDADGNLWLVIQGKGVDQFDIKNNTFHHYNPKYNRLSNEYPLQVFNDSRDNLWVATGWGLSFLRKGERIFKNFYYRKNDTTTIGSDETRAVYEDGLHNIWIGTSNGLNKFNYESQTFSRYSAGLKNNHVGSIISDKKNNIWVGTYSGISKFDPVTLEFANFNQNDGILSKQFIDRSCLRDSMGTLFFGGSDGIDMFNPDSLKTEIRKPTVVLTDFRLFNKSFTYRDDSSKIDRHISYAKKIILNYSDNSIAFRYQVINLIEAANINYAYKLDGFDRDWIYDGDKREANYTNLSPGKYTFKVKAKYKNGNWSDNYTSIELVVIPPWWMTTWFRILLGLLILASPVAYVYLRVKRLRHQRETLEVLVEERTREIILKNELLSIQAQTLEENNEQLKNLNSTKNKLFSIISHDLRNPFHNILGFQSLLSQKYNDFSDAERQSMISIVHSITTHVYYLVENLLSWAKVQTSTIKHSPVPFYVSKIITHKSELYRDIAITKNITIAHEIPDDLIAFADVTLFETTMRNLINNAIKFTACGGSILIRATKNSNMITIEVIDSGEGMTKEQVDCLFDLEKTRSMPGTNGESGSGLGLILCKEFVEKNNGSITVVSQPGKGSTFSFTVPAPPTE